MVAVGDLFLTSYGRGLSPPRGGNECRPYTSVYEFADSILLKNPRKSRSLAGGTVDDT